jgi:hypothetical protein
LSHSAVTGVDSVVSNRRVLSASGEERLPGGTGLFDKKTFVLFFVPWCLRGFFPFRTVLSSRFLPVPCRAVFVVFSPARNFVVFGN